MEHTRLMPATYKIGGLAFNVDILDTRNVYGRTDYRITPTTGTGSKWVNSRNVAVNSDSGIL